MVPSHSCYIYVVWRSKEVGSKALKLSFGVAVHKEGQFLWERGVLIMYYIRYYLFSL